jgi:hypothetical protein
MWFRLRMEKQDSSRIMDITDLTDVTEDPHVTATGRSRVSMGRPSDFRRVRIVTFDVNTQGQGSPMVQQGPDGATLGQFYNPGDIVGAPGPVQATGSNHALPDYQMQLMLLEQQNKKRLMMARQELDMENVGAPGPVQATGSNHALLDYQLQLMLLEQQNKKRLMIARQEGDIENGSTQPAPTT